MLCPFSPLTLVFPLLDSGLGCQRSVVETYDQLADMVWLWLGGGSEREGDARVSLGHN